MFLNNNTSGLNDFPPPLLAAEEEGGRLLSEASLLLNCISESFLTDENSKNVMALPEKKAAARLRRDSAGNLGF